MFLTKDQWDIVYKVVNEWEPFFTTFNSSDLKAIERSGKDAIIINEFDTTQRTEKKDSIGYLIRKQLGKDEQIISMMPANDIIEKLIDTSGWHRNYEFLMRYNLPYKLEPKNSDLGDQIVRSNQFSRAASHITPIDYHFNFFDVTTTPSERHLSCIEIAMKLMRVDILINLGQITNDAYIWMIDLIKNGRPMDICDNVILLRPVEVFTTLEKGINRLHNELDYALKWKSGRKEYHWHGVEVPERYIMDRDSITALEYTEEPNLETKRCLFEILGGERLVKLLKAKVIQKDQYGELMEAKVKIGRKRELGREVTDYISYKFVKCQDASTDRTYFLPVPSETETAHAGVAWSFPGMTEETYHPEVET